MCRPSPLRTRSRLELSAVPQLSETSVTQLAASVPVVIMDEIADNAKAMKRMTTETNLGRKTIVDRLKSAGKDRVPATTPYKIRWSTRTTRVAIDRQTTQEIPSGLVAESMMHKDHLKPSSSTSTSDASPSRIVIAYCMTYSASSSFVRYTTFPLPPTDREYLSDREGRPSCRNIRDESSVSFAESDVYEFSSVCLSFWH